jgi:acyl-CoA thioester hydrolase
MNAFLTGDITLEVPFHDVDLMGVAWHGHYAKYLEIARTALMRQAGLDWQQMKDWGVVWPVVKMDLKYIRPLRYGQKVRIQSRLLEYETRIRIAYLLTDPDTGEKVHKAETVQLAVDSATGELLFDCPEALKRALGSRVDA